MHKYIIQNPSHIVKKLSHALDNSRPVCFSLRLESAEKKCHVEHYTVFLQIIQCVNYFIIISLLPYALHFKKAILCVQYLSTHESLLRFAGITLKILPQIGRILSFFLQKASHIFTYEEIFIECNVNSYHIAVLPRWHKCWQKLLCQLPTLHTLVAPFLLLESINCHYHPINAQTVIFFSLPHIFLRI